MRNINELNLPFLGLGNWLHTRAFRTFPDIPNTIMFPAMEIVWLNDVFAEPADQVYNQPDIGVSFAPVYHRHAHGATQLDAEDFRCRDTRP